MSSVCLRDIGISFEIWHAIWLLGQHTSASIPVHFESVLHVWVFITHIVEYPRGKKPLAPQNFIIIKEHVTNLKTDKSRGIVANNSEAHCIHQMVQRYGTKLAEDEDKSQSEVEARSSQKMIKKDENVFLRSQRLECGLVPVPQEELLPKATSHRKGCLKPASSPQTLKRREKHVSFSTPGARCLITNTPYETHSQDGKSWRQQKAEEIYEERTRQALSGSEEYRPYVKTDRWADNGWESTGLGEDTPMGGISEEMDIEAALWQARQMEFDARLEEQQDLAEEHRFAMERETRHLYCADGLLGTRDFVRHRLSRMTNFRKSI